MGGRFDTEQALSCLWLNDKRFVATIRDPHPFEETQARRSMERYAGYTKLKKMAMMVVAHRSTNDEIGILRKIFQKYASTTSSSSPSTTRTMNDKKMKKSNSNGCISYAEFRDVWKESGFPPEDTKFIFDACDLDGSGKIAYTEFLAATIGDAQTGLISEERLAEAFDRFDTDDSGTISIDNLAEILGTDMPRSEIQDIIDDACNIDNYGSGKAGSTSTSTIGKSGRWGRKNGSTRSNTNQSENNGSGNGTTQHQHISYSAFLALWERNNNEKKREVVHRTSNTINTKTVRQMEKLGTGSRQQEQQCMLTGLVVPIEHHNRRNDDGHRRRRNDVAPLESINKALSTAAVTNTRLLQ